MNEIEQRAARAAHRHALDIREQTDRIKEVQTYGLIAKSLATGARVEIGYGPNGSNKTLFVSVEGITILRLGNLQTLVVNGEDVTVES